MSKIAHSSACGGHFAPSAEMEKIELCAVIKFLNLKALTMAEIHNELVAVYGSKAPSISAVKERMAAFKRGREDLGDDPPEWYRPSNACTQCNTEKVLDLVMNDRRMTVSQVRRVVSPDFFGEFENYTFLESLWYGLSENPCCHLRPEVFSRHFWHLKMAAEII